MQTPMIRPINRIILASTSPRRIELLKAAHLDFEVMNPGTEEVTRPGETPPLMVARLAREKATQVAGRLMSEGGVAEPSMLLVKEGTKWIARIPTDGTPRTSGARVDSKSATLVISADTTVVAPGSSETLGKPENPDHAFKLLSQIAGKTHEVLTAYCLLEVVAPGTQPPARQHVAVVSTQVTMRALGDAQIRRYIQTGEPMDKAGAYAAQGVGMMLIERIEGSYTNVVGLPMCQLLADMEQLFGIPLLGAGK